MRLTSVIILLLTIVLPQTSIAERYVRNITINRNNVFDRELEDDNQFMYRMANSLHIVTREHVISREILFNRGDPLSDDLLIETMRNIRSLNFIGDAWVDSSLVGTDSLDLHITTQDLWTTIVGASSQGGGGIYSITAFAEEKNIAGLGLGLETEATFSSDDDDGFSLRAYDSRLFGTRNRINTFYKDFEFNKRHQLNLFRPFYSLDTRYTYALSINDDELVKRLFNAGEEIYRYNIDFTNISFSIGRAFGRNHRIEPYLFYRYTDYDYDLYPGEQDFGIIPEDETFAGPGLGFRLHTHRYITALYLDEFGSTEDLTEHLTLTTTMLWSGPTFGGNNNNTSVAIEFSGFARPLDFLYTGFKNTYTSLYNGDLKRDRIYNTTSGILYIKPLEYQLFAIRTIAQYAWRQKSDFQLTLGGDTGLRGYPDRHLTGNRRLLTNIEYRIFTPIEILTVGLGAAVFFDAGNVWKSQERIAGDDLKTNVGVGLRFGLTKSSTARVVRIDLAKALNENNLYISFGTESIFGLGRYQ